MINIQKVAEEVFDFLGYEGQELCILKDGTTAIVVSGNYYGLDIIARIDLSFNNWQDLLAEFNINDSEDLENIDETTKQSIIDYIILPTVDYKVETGLEDDTYY